MKNFLFLVAAFVLLCVNGNAQINTPATPSPVPTGTQTGEGVSVAVTPKVVATYEVGQVATLQFRAQLADGRTMSDFRNLPITIGTYDSIGRNVTAATTKCDMSTGICFVKVATPGYVFVTAWLNGAFGIQSVALNFANIRGSFPATMDVTATMGQAQEGVSSSVIATSPISVEGPVMVTVETPYTNDSIRRSVYLPNGVSYGQRIELNTETLSPLSFRDRRNFRVQLTKPDGSVLATGTGSSVGLTEWKSVDASMDDNGDLSFVLDSSYNASVDYSITLLRGDRFRLELSQIRGELFVYPQGNKTKIVFNKGSLGENMYFLPSGFYTVNVNAIDRSNSIRWSQSRADGLGLNGQYILR